MIHALNIASAEQKNELIRLTTNQDDDKVLKVLDIFRQCGVDDWARDLKDKYIANALKHLEEIAVLTVRKESLKELAAFLVQRDY